MLKRIKLNEDETGIIELFNKEGNSITAFDLHPGINEINLYEMRLPSGTYSYNVTVNTKIIEIKNLVIICN